MKKKHPIIFTSTFEMEEMKLEKGKELIGTKYQKTTKIIKGGKNYPYGTGELQRVLYLFFLLLITYD